MGALGILPNTEFYRPSFIKDELHPGVVVLRGFAKSIELQLGMTIARVAERAPFRHNTIPGGATMSVASTNCGYLGWVADATGYRYDQHDPLTGSSWPAMGETMRELAIEAALVAGYADFDPDACLINRYAAGTKLGLHQDKDEKAFDKPIVSVSLGLPATFQIGGLKRSDPIQGVKLEHGDVVVFGGPARLMYHGILPLKAGNHPLMGEYRFNLTFRQVFA